MFAPIQRLLPPGLFQRPTELEKNALNEAIKTVEDTIDINNFRKKRSKQKLGDIVSRQEIDTLANPLSKAGLSQARVRQALFFRTYGRLGVGLVGGLFSILSALFGPAGLSLLFNVSATGGLIGGGFHFLSARKRMPELKRIIEKMKELKP